MQHEHNGGQDALVEELERMLNEQLLLNPDDLKLRLRLARVHTQLQRKDAFLGEAQAIYRLVKGEKKHPAMIQIADLASKLGVDPELISKRSDASHQRRLGEDQASRDYFLHLEERYRELSGKASLVQALDRVLLRNFNRPSSLMHAQHFSENNGGAQVAIKREDLLGSGTKQVMAVTGQVVMARLLGYKVVVTGSQNLRTGVLMTSMAARLGLGSVVYINERLASQNSSAVLHMRCVGARIETVDSRLNARDEAMDDCIRSQGHFLVMGVDAAPAPFPELNQQLISALGREIRGQCQAMFKRAPDVLVSRGSNTADAFGFFDPYLDQPHTRLVAVESRDTLAPESSSGDQDPFKRNVQLSASQLQQAETILEGSEYPAVRREHANYKDSGRVEYTSGSSHDAQAALKGFARYEGLILPIRTAYAVGWAVREAREMDKDQVIIVNMTEPYDKDLREVAGILGYRSY